MTSEDDGSSSFLLKELLETYSISNDEEIEFSERWNSHGDNISIDEYSAEDDDYHRYVEEFDNIIQKRQVPTVIQEGDVFLTAIEDKASFGIDEDFEEIHKMLDQDDFVEEYLSTVNELKNSIVTAVGYYLGKNTLSKTYMHHIAQIKEKVQHVPITRVETPRVVNKSLSLEKMESPRITESTSTRDSIETLHFKSSQKPKLNKEKSAFQELLLQSEILKRKFEEENMKRIEEEQRIEKELQEKKRKILEEKRKQEEERKREEEQRKKELEEQERKLFEHQQEIQRKIEIANQKKQQELLEEAERQTKLKELIIKKKEEQKIKEVQEKERQRLENIKKSEERKRKIELDKQKKEEERKRKMEEERRRKEEEQKRQEEERRRKEEEALKLQKELEVKRQLEEKKKELAKAKENKRNFIVKTIAEALQTSKKNSKWTVLERLTSWKSHVQKFLKSPPISSMGSTQDLKPAQAAKLNVILDEDIIDNSMPFEKDNSQVTHINIRGEDISSAKHNLFTAFPKVRALILDTNLFQSLSSLSGLPSLETLSVNDNRLSTLDIPRESASKLKELYALGNNISSITPLKNTNQLRSINLCNNKIQDLSGIQNNKKLQYLRIDINKLTDLRILDAFTNLCYLDVGYNELESIDKSLMFNLLLEDIILYQNKITSIPSFHHVLLKSLYLNSNQLTSLPQSFLFSPLIQYLNLSGNKLEHLSPLSSCIMLRNINLSFNNLQSIDELLHLRFCRNVEEMKLNDNPIARGVLYKELSIALLPNLTNLDGEVVSSLARQNVFSHFVFYSPRLTGHVVSFINHSLKRSVPSINSSMFRDNQYKFMRDAITLDKSQRSLQSLKTNEWNTKTTYYYMCSRHINERSQFSNYHQCISSEKVTEKNFKDAQIRFSRRLDNRLSQYDAKVDQKQQHFEEHLGFNPKRHQNVFTINAEYEEKLKKLNSAILIQRWFRLWKIRRKKRLREREEKAAIEIQRNWRGYITRKHNLDWILHALNKRHKAATKIQSVWKGYRVRTILKKARQFEADEIFELESAVDDIEYPSSILNDYLPINIKIPENRTKKKIDVYYYNVHTKTSHGGDESIKELYRSANLNMPQQLTEENTIPSLIVNRSNNEVKSKNGWMEEEDEAHDSHESSQLAIDEGNTSTQSSVSSQKSSNSNLEAIKNTWHFKNIETAKDLFAKNSRVQKIKKQKQLREEMKDPMKRLEMFKKKSSATTATSIQTSKSKSSNKQNLATHTAHIDTDMELRSLSSSETDSRHSSENLRLPKINNKPRGR
ncbi:hypothetical protein C9374_010313 [Naegleria lovaniensis]|uniref:Uncharacterized protein n=1 Tax=Naegleria lovaniensis TaxID=51637 RepID=A0AA88GI10_NAELO|nr:uncharacterized protein C9374_010313 [Naegleria lovaniensis]KAG2374939.1 hypothetical protein C9374_010313 [Naegleria lovaniensis]